jgi:hypothetical protein
VPQGARLCRACYTVIPQTAAEAASPKPLALAKYASQFLVIAGLAWYFGAFQDFEASSAGRAPQQLTALDQNAGFFEQFRPTAALDISSPGGFSASSGSNPQPVSRKGAQCTLQQAVRNTGSKALSRVSFEVALLGSGGQRIGDEVSVTVATDLPPGSERYLDLQLECPPTAASGRVSLPDRGTDGVESQMVTLVEQPTSATAAGAQVAVEAPLEFCPAPEPCDLQVSIEGGGTATFPFRRDPEAPTMLVSDNPILTSHLLGNGRADLSLEAGSHVAKVELSQRQVRRTKQPSILARWLGMVL